MHKRNHGQNGSFNLKKFICNSHASQNRRQGIGEELTIYATCFHSFPYHIVLSCIYHVKINLNKICLKQDKEGKG